MKISALNPVPLMVHGLMPGAEECNMETSIFECAPGIFSGKQEDECREILKPMIEAHKPDYVIFEGYQPTAFFALMNLCKEKGIGSIYWAIEDPVLYDYTIPFVIKADFAFTTAVECIDKYRERSLKVDLLTFACNPKYHKTGHYKEEYALDIALQASYYNQPSRIRGYDIVLDPALQGDYSINIWGAYWETELGKQRLGQKHNMFKGYFPNHDLPDLCASAKIILGVQCDDTSLTQTSMRPYEVLGCRGFHLTQRTFATEAIFKDGEHLVTAGTAAEASEKIKFYLENESERLRIANSGQEYVYANHTYERRVREVMLPRLLGGI